MKIKIIYQIRSNIDIHLHPCFNTSLFEYEYRFLPALSKIDFNTYITIALFANMKCLSATLNFYLCLNCKFKIDSSSSLTLICLEAKVHAFNCSSISCSLNNKYSIKSTHNIRFDPRIMKSIFDPLKSIFRTIEMDSS